LWTPNDCVGKSINISLYKLAHARILFKRPQKLIRVITSERHSFNFSFPSEEGFDEYIKIHQSLQREKDTLPNGKAPVRSEKKNFIPECPFPVGTRVTIHVKF